jgi:hypothetical protein
MPDIATLSLSEWSPEFERLMRNRLLMGAFRYGRLNAQGKPDYDRIEAAIRLLKDYQRTGNQEDLVDASNCCLLEFEEGSHPLKHFGARDDGEHIKEK